jgi:hypothetical protein
MDIIHILRRGTVRIHVVMFKKRPKAGERIQVLCGQEVEYLPVEAKGIEKDLCEKCFSRDLNFRLRNTEAVIEYSRDDVYVDREIDVGRKFKAFSSIRFR